MTMHKSTNIAISLLLSLALHAVFIGSAFILTENRFYEEISTPVEIVRLPAEVSKRLPPLERPLTRRYQQPSRFGKDEEVKLPRTMPAPAAPGRGEEYKGKESTTAEKGPLPFLTQRDIDELARKGMPPRPPGDDSVTLDTDEFKFISYNRWLKMKVESRLRYPELAAVSGIQGVLFLRFDIMKDGSLGNLELLKSSGYKILDDEALRAIRDSAPFQPLPDEWNMERYPIRAAVIFYLNEAYIR